MFQCIAFVFQYIVFFINNFYSRMPNIARLKCSSNFENWMSTAFLNWSMVLEEPFIIEFKLQSSAESFSVWGVEFLCGSGRARFLQSEDPRI